MKTEKAQNQIFSIKFRIYPNKSGKATLKRCFAASRKYWNHQVAAQTENLKTWSDRKEEWVKNGGEKHLQDLKDKMKKDLGDGAYEKDSDDHKAAQKEIRVSGFPGMNIPEVDKEFRKLRNGNDEEFNWTAKTPSRIIGGQYKRLSTSYREGWKKRKNKSIKWRKGEYAKKPFKGFPKFRSWRDNQYFDCEANQMHLDWEKSLFKLPVIEGWIKFKQHVDVQELLKEYPDGRLGMCVFTCSPTDKYHFIVPIDTGVPLPEKKDYDESSTVGIDVGIRNYITLSDKTEIDNTAFLEKFGLDFSGDKLSPYKTNPKLTRRKTIRQRKLARKEFKSKNYDKQRLVCARIDEKIRNRRDDYTHEISRAIANLSFNAVAVEDLDINQMKEKKAPVKGEDGKYKRNGQAQKRNLNRQINDVAWGSFFTKLNYKLDREGKQMIRIDRYEPTSKKCLCGYINRDLKLSQSSWECPDCGAKNDRDKLAAFNIKNYALGGLND